MLSLSLVTLARADEEPSTKTFTYKTIPDGKLEMVVHYPPGWKDTDKRPAIVFFFGGGWENGTIQAFVRQADHLARRGMVAARADYRVKSRQGVTPDKCVEDAKSAVRWLRANASRLGIDPDRIVAAGGSAGGHIAACTALTDGLDAEGEDRSVSSKPNALVLFNPVLRFHGLPAMMKRIDNDEAVGKAISPTLHVSKATPPTLLFFGTRRLAHRSGEGVPAASQGGGLPGGDVHGGRRGTQLLPPPAVVPENDRPDGRVPDEPGLPEASGECEDGEALTRRGSRADEMLPGWGAGHEPENRGPFVRHTYRVLAMVRRRCRGPPQPKLSVLIVDGMNNHDWERATRILKAILLDSGRFKVDVSTSPPANDPPACGVEA